MINFGKIKNEFNSILTEGLEKKDISKKKLFQKYIRTIRENEVLRTQFLIYTNIENKSETDINKAIHFINENIALLDKFDRPTIIKANEDLVANLSLVNEDIKNELYDSINSLIFLKKNPNNINERIEAQYKIADYIVNNQPKQIAEETHFTSLPISMVSDIMVNIFNERYEGLDDSDKDAFKAIFESNGDERKRVYSTTIRECIDLIDNRLKECDIDTKDKLLTVKDKLLSDTTEINENFINNISNLIALKSRLITEA